ncbi:MAG: peptidoglycan editing factor PgeF [Methyloligellaceae bacterium]
MTAKFLTATNLHAIDNIRHGFFTTAGGQSSGIYSSLNCGYGSADIYENVRENRQLVASALDADADQLCTPYQIHSATAVIVNKAWTPTEAPEADAVVTNVPGIRVGILSADCCPVLFADTQMGVVGAAHAGWRGAFSGVTDDTLAKMESLGASRDRIAVAIGPTISQYAYEVGPEFRDNFITASPQNDLFFVQRPNGKFHFDLTGYISERLEKAGINRNNIQNPGICTYSNESLFFSYRRSVHLKQPDYGRQISAIGLK